MCAPVLTAIQILALRIALGQEASYTVLIDLSPTELRNGHSLILGRGSARLEDKATERTHAVSACCILGHVGFQIDPSSRESGGPGNNAVCDREAHIQSSARSLGHGRETVTWWKSRWHYMAPVR